ncbi:unnamed protein product [Vitrella brassicaformis CCMP3155]|uniref:Uncharacterized protein n=1 Tax=Vitrella brassicaformis (strain CCMP3155) TaxID=1169540 RepID=A0A0G4GPM6_VITBC|nr:unnamed protein product [Vitrella brassicaformis CCMP3155]|mmetsp:Transcript_47136/g.117556  ORF Transcript_47136/g.117556 Transcript_47136/m.117556 type:complete len:233 (-) Transcript_47136:453-1151(-)|eukprot:CEM32304.1 unnamed protein product [Vitrella brassicaformis CCMP3155]
MQRFMVQGCLLSALVVLSHGLDAGRSDAAFVPSSGLRSLSRAGSSRRAGSAPETTMMAELPVAVPFLGRPKNLPNIPGDKGFDPLGFSEWANMDWMREAELKHGRISMLAFLGYVVADMFKLPGPEHAVSSLQAHDKAVEYGAMGQILLWVSFLEMISLVALTQTVNMGSGRKPGAFGFDPLGFCKNKDPDYVRDMEEKEITHCRAAMLAISGVLTQDAVFKTGFPYIGSYT